jgi:hypothetical protein
MIGIEIEILASVGVSYVDGVQFRLFPDEKVGRRIYSDSISKMTSMEGLKILRLLRKFCNCPDP